MKLLLSAKPSILARKIAIATVVATGVGFVLPSIAFAQSPVLAKVGDMVVTEADLAQAEKDMAQQFARVPEDQRRAAMLSAVVDMKLMAALAKSQGVDQSEKYKARIEFLKTQTLHNVFFEEKIAPTISADAVKARYETELKGVEAAKQVSARHILVKTEEEALAIIKELQGGKDFVEVAKEKSTGPSGANGGDLGYFGKGQMVPEFEVAAFALEKGAITTTPIKTQFGYHIIKKEDERDAPLPTLEESQSQIRQILLQEKYLESVAAAKELATVTIMDEVLETQIKALKAK